MGKNVFSVTVTGLGHEENLKFLNWLRQFTPEGDLSKLIEEFEKDGSIVGVRVTFTNKDLTIDDNIKYS